MVSLNNLWDEELFNPDAAKEAISLMLQEMVDAGYKLPDLTQMGEFFVTLYQDLQSKRLTSMQFQNAKSLLEGFQKCL